VHEESKLAGQGRIEGPGHTMLIQTAAAEDAFPSIGQASLALSTFPFGNAAYAYGSLFVEYLAQTHGDSSIRTFVESSSAQLIPYLIDVPAKRAFGTTFSRAWSDWRTAVETKSGRAPRTANGWRDLAAGVDISFPRWSGDSSLTYTGSSGKE